MRITSDTVVGLLLHLPVHNRQLLAFLLLGVTEYNRVQLEEFIRSIWPTQEEPNKPMSIEQINDPIFGEAYWFLYMAGIRNLNPLIKFFNF